MMATTQRMLTKQMRAFYDLGFAVHLLKPRSKKPVEDKWTTGDRKKWSELEAQYRRGMNVGVRLGAASKIGDRYLAVIDCDVKSKEPKHLKEMREKLASLFGDDAPVVLSGRGNGSQHVYVVTDEPVSPQRLAQSAEKVKVHMPSVERVSPFERENLTEKEIKKGIRLRAAWEISLMGEGQQVVLPPSVHPDSGEPYAWENAPVGDFAFPHFSPPKKREKGLTEISIEGFDEVDVDLTQTKLDSEAIAMIVDGEGVEDRSAALLGAANRMVRARMKDAEILSVLTEPGYYLGAAAYEHADTDSRKVAARWIARYTLPKAKKDSSHADYFEDTVEVVLSKKEIKRLEAEDRADWRDAIERESAQSGGRPKPTFKNVLTILRGECGPDCFKRNDFAGAELYGCDTPWGGKKGDEIKDIDPTRIRVWLTHEWRFEPHINLVHEAISAIADLNRFHPVRDYLDGLEWDGVPRVDTWLATYMEATGADAYLRAVSRKVLVALIKRVYRPGCKFDHVLILEGNQGVGKSTALRNLVGDDWFTDAKINVQDKDAVMTLKSKWLVELGELSALRNADIEELKAFISRTTDRIRVPYGKRAEEFPRQCVFIGSTNKDEYLKDPTGNRRYWPVKVGACDFTAIAKDRDQLLAEARFLFECGEPLYLEKAEMNEAAIKEQEARLEKDPWEDLFDAWKDRESSKSLVQSGFAMDELFEAAGPFESWRCDMKEAKRAATILKKRGYARKRYRRNGVRGWYWIADSGWYQGLK